MNTQTWLNIKLEGRLHPRTAVGNLQPVGHNRTGTEIYAARQAFSNFFFILSRIFVI